MNHCVIHIYECFLPYDWTRTCLQSIAPMTRSQKLQKIPFELDVFSQAVQEI